MKTLVPGKKLNARIQALATCTAAKLEYPDSFYLRHRAVVDGSQGRPDKHLMVKQDWGRHLTRSCYAHAHPQAGPAAVFPGPAGWSQVTSGFQGCVACLPVRGAVSPPIPQARFVQQRLAPAEGARGRGAQPPCRRRAVFGESYRNRSWLSASIKASR